MCSNKQQKCATRNLLDLRSLFRVQTRALERIFGVVYDYAVSWDVRGGRRNVRSIAWMETSIEFG